MARDFFFELLREYGNIGLLISLTLEFIGLPVPGEPMMSFFGYFIHHNGTFALLVAILFASAGSFLGSFVAYLISYKYGEGFVLKAGKYFFITRDKLHKTEKVFEKYQILLLLFSRYVPGLRHIVPYFCGVIRMNPAKYHVFNLLGSLIWCFSFLVLGYTVGENWRKLIHVHNVNILIGILLVIFILVVFKFFKKHKYTILAISLPLLTFIKLSEVLIRAQFSVFDNRIYLYITRFINPHTRFFMELLSFLGSPSFLIGLTLLLFVWFQHHPRYSGYWLIVAANLAASALITEVFKSIFQRERPDILQMVEVTGYSFPSGHSMIGLSFYGLLLYLFCIHEKGRKRIAAAILFPLLIFFIGFSRIYLGVHYASDVLAGFSVGLSWLVMYVTLVKNLPFAGLKNPLQP